MRKSGLFCRTLLWAFALLLASSHVLLAAGTTAQSIQIITPGTEIPLNSAPFQVIALASSYLPVTLSIDGPATLTGRLLTITGPGNIQVTASQAGNAAFAPTSAQVVLHAVPVQPRVQTTAATLTYGSPFDPALLNATVTAAPVVDPSADTPIITTQLDSSQLGFGGQPTLLPTAPVLRYENAVMSPTTDPNGGGGYNVNVFEPPYALNYRVAFTCDCRQFEMVIQAREAAYRLWVDGAYSSTDAIQEPHEYFRRFYVLVSFPDKRARQIKFFVNGNSPFFGINVPSGDTITAPQVPLGPRVMIFGDSWTGPTILPPLLPPMQTGLDGGGYPAMLGEYFNWDYWDDGIGGTGFTVTGNDQFNRTFVERAKADACPNDFAAVLILGGTNDGGATANSMQAAVGATLSELHQCLPKAPVYLYGPQNPNPPLEQGMADAVASAAGTVTFTDMSSGTPWFYGDSSDPSAGNNYVYLNGHPTPLGHDYLAEQIARDLVTRFPKLMPQFHTLFNPAPLTGQFSYSADPGALLPAGPNTVSVSFAPEDSVHYAPVSATATITVMRASSSLALSPVSGSNRIIATASPQFAGTPTGTVSFTDNGAPLGTVALAGATASIALGSGTHSITASYSGDGNFVSSSSNAPLLITSIAPDFAFSLNQAQLTIAPGAQASVALDITPSGGLSGALTLACLGLPANAACTFNPSSLRIAGAPLSTTVTIQTSTASAVQAETMPFRRGPIGKSTIAFCSLLGTGVLWPRRRRLKRCLHLPVLALLLCAGLSGCGSTYAAHPAASTAEADTVPGRYTVQVQVTAGTEAAAVTHTQTIVLQVS